MSSHDWLILVSIMSILSHVSEFPSSLRLNKTLLHAYTTLCLFIHPPMELVLLLSFSYNEYCHYEHGSSRSCFQFFRAYTQKWNCWIIRKHARKNINNLRYTDDTILIAEKEEKLKNLLMKMKQESWKNLSKTQHSKN